MSYPESVIDQDLPGDGTDGPGTVLVAGAAGFIGSHACERLLADGHRVVAVDDLSLGRVESLLHLRDHERFTFERIDIAKERRRMRRLFRDHPVDTVWHLAANSDIREGSRDRRIDLERTFGTTTAILEAAAAGAVRRFVFASTSAVFGETAGPLAETAGPLEPVSFYGAAKLASEAYVAAFAHRSEIDSWIFRFPNVVGSRATHGVILDLVHKIRDTGRLEVLGDGTQTKPYLHVNDLLDGMQLALRHRGGCLNVFHLAGEGLTSVRDIAHWTASAAGLPADRIVFGEGDRGWPGDVPRFEYDCSKIASLGWSPALRSDEAVRRAIDEIVSEEMPCCAKP